MFTFEDKTMTKLNIASTDTATFNEQTTNARNSFDAAFGTLTKAYSRRLQIERDSLGDAFDADVFWADNSIADHVVESSYRRPKMKPGTLTPVLRKGQPVIETSRFNKRDVQNAASFIRGGIRSKRAKDKLIQVHGSIEAAVANRDGLGNVLGMVRRMDAAGLVTNNAAANDSKNAALTAYSGETPSGSARKALIASLYGQSVTSAQVKQLTDALTQFAEDVRTARKIVTDARPYVAPAPLTFAGVFGTVTTIKAHKEKKSRKVTIAPVVETPMVAPVIEATA
jgi:hypothetical protein